MQEAEDRMIITDLIARHPFATVDIAALILLVISFVFILKLHNLMGKGKDTGPVKLLLIVIAVNLILAVTLLAALYQKYIGAYFNYIRITDISLFIIGVILAFSAYKIYRDYEKLVKKNEPGE